MLATLILNVGKDRSKRKKSCTYDSIMTIKNHLILSLKIERAEYVHLYQVGMKKILRDAFYTVFYEGREEGQGLSRNKNEI